MNGKIRRIFSILLTLTLLGSTMPLPVLAEEMIPESQTQEIVEDSISDVEMEEIPEAASEELGEPIQGEAEQDIEENVSDIPMEDFGDGNFEGSEDETEAFGENSEEESDQQLQTYSNQLPETIPVGETYTLSGDVVMESGQWFESIEGTLDGNGYTITLTDKPLANNVTGTIQNLGVTSEDFIESSDTCGSMAMNFSGVIQNCFSTVKLKLNDKTWSKEAGGLVGTATGGVIQNSYFAGTVQATMTGFYGGLVGINNSSDTQLRNCCYGEGSLSGPVSMAMQQPLKDNVEEKSVSDFQSGAANTILNTDLPETGFSWTMPSDGSNQGFPVLMAGTVEPEPQKPDKTYLQNLIAGCKDITQEGYTQESWALFSEALAEAEAVLENEKVTIEDVTNATTKLEAAKAGLKREKPTEPVAPPTDESQIRHISTEADLDAAVGSKGYYVLDNDLTITGMMPPLGEFQGVLDGQGHTITISGNREFVFQHLGEEGVLQNIHFTGTITAYGSTGPVGQNLKGTIVNCSSDVKGDYACGFAKRLQGGSILNSYSISEGKKGVLLNQYESGTLENTYWQDGNSNPANIPPEALINSSSKTEEELKSKEFVNLLNQNKGDYGTAWGQNSTGYPYFGPDQEYNPDKPNFPENRYEVVMVTAPEIEIPIENQTFTVSPDEVDSSGIVGHFQLKNIPESSTVSWEISEVKPDRSLMIGADKGDLRIDGEGSGVVTAIERKEDGSSEQVAWIKVVSKAQKLEEIQLFIDQQNVTNQQIQVLGSEEKKIEIKAKYQGSDDFVPANPTRFSYAASDEELIRNLNDSSSFSFKKPGTAKMLVTSKADNAIKAEVEITSAYVPVTEVRPAVFGTEVLHGRNANDPDRYAFLPNYGGVIVTPENASYADHWTVKSSDPSIAEYVDSMVKGYVPYKAGTVTYTASIEQTNPETGKTSTVTGQSEVTYAYQNPLTEVSLAQQELAMENFSEIPLELTFKGEISEEGWSVTYPELEWTYDKEGIVKVFKKEIASYKKDSQWEGAPDYGKFLTSDKYYVKSLKEGTVKVTGTPLDKTNQVQPITFTIKVLGGERPQVDNDALVARGIQGATEHLNALYPEQNYNYDDNDWIVYAKLRRGENIPEEKLQQYYDSVVKEVKSWKETKKPTDIERIMLVLSVMEKDVTDIGGVNLAKMIYDHPHLDSGSNELTWGLLALDAKKTQIPENAKWSRDKIISALLKFQNQENGGFGLTDNTNVGIDTTAMALQALAAYKDTDVQVHNAVERALLYLKNTLSENYNFSTSESTAQMLLTLTVLQIDPLNSDFGESYNNTITGLMEYYCETESGKGFCHDKENKKLNPMSSVQALQALTGYELYKNGQNTYWDLTEGEQSITAADVEAAIERLPQTDKLTLKDEDVVLNIKAQYDALSEEEKEKVKNIELLNSALKKMEELKALGKEVGTVSVSIMDGIQRADCAKGMILKTETAIFEKDSMMSIIQRCCEQNGIDIVVGHQGMYIEGIDGLAEFDRGPESGWKGTLDGIFPNKSFAECTVQNGEVKDKSVITVEYTENLGKDLEENAELKTPGLQGGKLKEEFERDRYEYKLIAEENKISFSPEFFNRYSVATIRTDKEVYDESQMIPVKDGMLIQLVSEKNVRGKDTRIYNFHVEKEDIYEPGPENPNEPEGPNKPQNVVLLNKKYGISLKGEGLTEDMELSVTAIGKGHEDVEQMRKEIPSNKSVFRLYQIKLLKKGKEIDLPTKALLSVPVGKEYEGKELTLLHCVDGKVEKLKGKVQDETLSVEVSSLGSIGVVIDTPSSGNGAGNGGNGGNGGNSGNNGRGGNGAIGKGNGPKTGDGSNPEVFWLLMLASVSILSMASVIYRKKKQ